MVSNYVPNYEERQYQVHPSQIGWAMHNLAQQPGYQVQGYSPYVNGTYVIVVQVPAGAPQMDWRAQSAPPRRWNPHRIARWLLLVVIAVALAYIAYSVFVGGLPQTTSSVQAKPEPSLWDRVTGVLPRGEPAVEHVKPAIEMPWDAAGRQVGEAVDTAGRILMGLVVLLLLGVVLWFAVKARGVWGAFKK